MTQGIFEEIFVGVGLVTIVQICTNIPCYLHLSMTKLVELVLLCTTLYLCLYN